VAVSDSLRDPLLNPAPSATSASAADSSSTGGSSGGTGSSGGPTGTGSTRGRQRPLSTSDQFNETVQLVKTYALQETVDPLKTAGRWIGFGVIGAVLIGFATALLTLGLLRLVQTEWPGTFGGRWTSLLPYLFAFLLCVLVASLAFSRINKQPLTKEKR
jgi:hypothetical protein